MVLGPASALRCYVCGGHSGTPCRGGMGDTGALEEGALDTEGTAGDPVQECTDLINNRGCVKQFVNGGKSGIMRCLAVRVYFLSETIDLMLLEES